MTEPSRRMTLRLCVYCVLFLVAELAIWFSYRHHDARFHWFAHFFTGATAALLIMSAVTWRSRRAVRYPLLWLLIAHVYAMFPDILFAVTGLIHKAWMDVFLLHISIHFIPRRNVTNYALFLLALATYLTVVRVRTAPSAAR